MITCTKCKKLQSVREYNWRNSNAGRRHSFCKKCHSNYRRNHYLLNRDKYLKKARNWNRNQTIKLRSYIADYLSSHACVDCGQRDIRVLDFDHTDQKKMGICAMIRNCHSINSIKLEISRCQVRCANCHRIKTFISRNFWKNIIGL
jgi:hypothetical protein